MKKKLKGMTLIEVIISMAVFGIAALLMVQIGASSKRMMYSTSHLNKKTMQEAPYGAAQDVTGLQDKATAINGAHTDPSEPDVTVETVPVTITVGSHGTVGATKYSTRVAAADDPYAQTNMQGDLEFYVIN